MRKLALIILAVGVLWFPSDSYADGYVSQTDVSSTINISSADGDAAVSFTNLVKTEGFTQLSLLVTHTYDAGTAVTMTCNAYEGAARSTAYEIQACDGSTTPTLTCQQATWSRATGATKRFVFNVALNYQFVSCTFTVTGGTSDDKLTVKGMLGAL